WSLAILVAGMFVWLARLASAEIPTPGEPALVAVMWEQRKLDVWMQLVFLFVGVLGILGLLVEAKLPALNHNGPSERESDASEIQQMAPLQPVTLFEEEQA